MKVISLSSLLYMTIPLLVVWFFYAKWVGNKKEIVYAGFRMVLQLLLIGYVLVYIFNGKSPLIGLLVIFIMITISSYIALRNVKKRDFGLYKKFFISILIGGSFNLLLVLYAVLDLHPIYQPRFIIPLAGMVYANSMNAISLVAERFENEISKRDFDEARAISFKASLIPSVNAFLAVGLVSLPGLMTGQILSGVDPIIAVRYQIAVMAMVLGSSGISSIIYLNLQKKR